MKMDMSYTKVYGFMDRQLGLDGKELRVFAVVYSFFEAGRRCITSIGYLAQRSYASVSSVIRAIKSLENAGLIVVKRADKVYEYTVSEEGIKRRIALLTNLEKRIDSVGGEKSESPTVGAPTVAQPSPAPTPKYCGTPAEEMLRRNLIRTYGEDFDL